MDFQKIKFNGKKVVLHWTSAHALEEHEHTLTSAQPPHPDFVAALQAFVGEVLDLLELPLDYGDGLTVVGLSLPVQEDGRSGLVVTCLKALKGAPSPLVLNTPYLAEPGDDPDAPALSRHLLRLIETAEGEAEAFVDGKRAQGDLFATEADRANDDATVTLSGGGMEPLTMTSREFSRAARKLAGVEG